MTPYPASAARQLTAACNQCHQNNAEDDHTVLSGATRGQTAEIGPERVRDLLPDESEELLKHRFAVVQVWRGEMPSQ